MHGSQLRRAAGNPTVDRDDLDLQLIHQPID